MVDDVKHDQFVVLFFDTRHKVQRSVPEDLVNNANLPLEDNFVVAPLEEVSELAAAADDHRRNLKLGNYG